MDDTPYLFIIQQLLLLTQFVHNMYVFTYIIYTLYIHATVHNI